MDDKLSRREFLRTTGLAGVGAIVAGLSAYRSPHYFEVSRHGAAVRGLKRPLRLSLLTDFHLGPYLSASDLTDWVDASNAADPDLVLLGGDLVDQRYRGDLSELLRLLPQLGSRLGVHAVPGNHDRTRYRDLAPLRAALTAAGVPLLTNQGSRLRDDLFLAGIDDMRVGHADVPAALAGRPAAAEAATILLSHNPDIIPELPPSIDLLLAGHTHGGQIRLPGLGPLVTSSAYGAKYADGWVEAPMPAFVSRGLGVTAVPVRFACPAEVVILDLEPLA